MKEEKSSPDPPPSDIPVTSITEDDINYQNPTYLIQKSSCLSKTFFFFMNKVVSIGNKRPYRFKDLFQAGDEYKYQIEFPKFKAFIDIELQKPKRASPIVLLFRWIMPTYIWGGICMFIANLMQIVIPLMIKAIVNWLKDPKADDKWGFIYASIILGIMLLRGVLNQNGMRILQQSSVRASVLLRGFLCDKIMKIPPGARKHVDVGKMSNFISVDVMRMMTMVMTTHQFVITPVMLIVYTVMVCIEIDWVGIFLPIMVFLLVILYVILTKKLLFYFMQRMMMADKRGKTVAETIQGMKVIKFNGWEQIMYDNVNEIRKKEKGVMIRLFVIQGIQGALTQLLPIVLTLICFSVYNVAIKAINVGQTYALLSLFQLSLNPIQVFLFALRNFASAVLASQRLDQLLQIDDYPDQLEEISFPKGTIELQNAFFSFEDPVLDEKMKKLGQPKKKRVPPAQPPKPVQDPKASERQDLKEDNNPKTQNQQNQQKPEVIQNIVLKNISMRIEPGSFTAIIGKVGSGKTALLYSMMNEMVVTQGTIKKNGRIALISQEAFLINSSLRENILFGEPYESARYNKVLDICELRDDLKMLNGGDMTEIGERGINLSGGQKQRISIARAIYQQADIYFIDDSLSALDAYVGKSIFDNVFNDYIKDKTRVMVTHAVYLLDKVEQVGLMKEGSLIKFGPFKEVSSTPEYQDFAKNAAKLEEEKEEELLLDVQMDHIMELEEEQLEQEELQKEEEDNQEQENVVIMQSHHSLNKQNPDKPQKFNLGEDQDLNDLESLSEARNMNEALEIHQQSATNNQKMQFPKIKNENQDQNDDLDNPPQAKDSKLTPGELELSVLKSNPQQKPLKSNKQSLSELPDLGQGNRKASRRRSSKRVSEKKMTEQQQTDRGKLVKQEVRFEGQVSIGTYCKYFAAMKVLMVLITFMCFLLGTGIRVFGDYWAGAWSQNTFKENSNFYSYVFIGIAGVSAINLVLKALFFGIATTNASVIMFQKMFMNILRRPMSFFDTTATGVILNRCQKDVDDVDFMIPMFFNMFIENVFHILGALILVVIITPIMIIILIICFVVFLYSIRSYVKTSTELRRLSQLATSPVLSRVSEMIGGLMIFRNYQKTEYVKHKFAVCLDLMNNCLLHERLLAAWINFRLEMIVAVLIGVTALLVVLTKILQLNSSEDVGVLALVLTWIFSLGNLVSFTIFTFSEVVKGMNSVQRIFEYIEWKEHEESWEDPKSPVTWPSNGQIELDQVNIRYRSDTPLVLNNLSFSINSYEKVGIIGRTGSGKSTVILALMRILELDDFKQNNQKGSIKIDGIQIDSIGLHELRKKIALIPQDPIILQGTLQFNVDPIGEHSQAEIIEVLKKVQLWDTIQADDIINAQKKQFEKMKMFARGKKGSQAMKKPDFDPKNVTDQQKVLFPIDSNGANLSVGQRQLICIARAMIRKPKVLLMDEATANIDVKTDAIIQEIIKNEFNESTVITIAHRLNTIIQYDKIVILSAGVLVEQGSPLELLQKDSLFQRQVMENGEEYFEKMMALATDKNLNPSDMK